MNIVHLIFTQKMVPNIPTSRVQGKMQTFKKHITLDQYGHDLSKMGPLLC